MKLHKSKSLLIDSGGGWFDSDSSAIAGVFSDPALTLCFCGKETKLLYGSREEICLEDPLDFIERTAGEGYISLGYISYDYLSLTTPGVNTSDEKDGERFPLLLFHFYPKENFYTVPWEEISASLSLPSARVLKPLQNIGRREYIDKISSIKEHITAGDVYQVNLSRRVRFAAIEEPLSWFLDFYRTQPVPFSAFVSFPGFEIISGSMELFLRKRGNTITTRPIKGTIRRDSNPLLDRELAEKLAKNPKERAENLMIVDLMRNDFGRICTYGSVKVTELFAIKPYSTLFQMESEIEGRLRPGVGFSRIINSTFPPGSVTGAPKREALRIIDSLEPHIRGPYCGAVCLFHPSGDFTISVAIRTGVNHLNGADFWFGGGIVWDSQADEEYEETELKAKALELLTS
ncbi:MAG: anthranilate synthase component I family protein [Candidatus Dadabacteria bacterium]|nr:anthranilate synthase component I family protein [Candidatus Dadabacteria bacterium]MCY4262773.1 anthranilate synthase component I family protein [Candidatus Dadabacteria bacterium]